MENRVGRIEESLRTVRWHHAGAILGIRHELSFHSPFPFGSDIAARTRSEAIVRLGQLCARRRETPTETISAPT